jgi:hypothetical protein
VSPPLDDVLLLDEEGPPLDDDVLEEDDVPPLLDDVLEEDDVLLLDDVLEEDDVLLLLDDVLEEDEVLLLDDELVEPLDELLLDDDVLLELLEEEELLLGVQAPLTQAPPAQGVPSGFAPYWQVPAEGSHAPAAWHSSGGGQVSGAPPLHAPAWQVSACVHASPSLHALPSALFGLEQAPVDGLQVPATWH